MTDDQNETQELIATALHCADTGDATHWPTVAGILAQAYREAVAKLKDANDGKQRLLLDNASWESSYGVISDQLAQVTRERDEATKENAHLCNELAACEEQRDRNAELCESARADLSAVKRERDHLQAYVIPEKDKHGKYWEDLAQERLAQLSRLQSACGEKDRALLALLASASPSKTEHPTMWAAWQTAQAALTTSGDTLGEEGKSEQWRILGPKETIVDGDECWNFTDQNWQHCTQHSIGRVIGVDLMGCYRRAAMNAASEGKV
jgi:hypothetical protein